jgi:hybrid cluster-associated redox disulfide protein
MQQLERMHQAPAITSDLLIDQVMRRWPATIRVFLNFKTYCVGCPFAAFQTIDDACREHGLDRSLFLEALTLAARKSLRG